MYYQENEDIVGLSKFLLPGQVTLHKYFCRIQGYGSTLNLQKVETKDE